MYLGRSPSWRQSAYMCWNILTAERMVPRRFPVPWSTEQIPGGYVVKDATGQSIAYVYARDTKADADTAKVLTFDEARRIAANIAKLPTLLKSD
jgi:hypothetical protein